MTETKSDSKQRRYLPPDVNEEQFEAALTLFRNAIGTEWVVSDPATLAKFLDPYPIKGQEHFVPSAVLSPGSVEEVQAIVRIANETRVPISPISTGKNNGYGGSSPRLSGAVVVNLGQRMNRILEINERFGYALVEPGVTYFDLYNHLQETKSGLMLDCPDLGWGSIVGNTMDRGVGYTPYGDHFLWQTGMEVVLPNAEVMRTGMGAVPGSNTWQLFPYGFGPYPDGLFTQSNFGVVTKMGMALMQRPPASMTYLVTFDNEDDLAQIVDIMLPLRINMAPIQNRSGAAQHHSRCGRRLQANGLVRGRRAASGRGHRADEERTRPRLLEFLRHPLRPATGDRNVLGDDQGSILPGERSRSEEQIGRAHV